MNRPDIPAFERLLAEVAACYNRKEYPEAAVKTWFRELEEFPFGLVSSYMRNWIRTKSKPPTIADIVTPLADRLSSQIEAQTQANNRATALPTPVTPHGIECMAKIREIMANPRAPGRWWAYEIRDKHRRGEHLNFAQMELAKHACGLDWDTDNPYLGPGQRARVPGEDDE